MPTNILPWQHDIWQQLVNAAQKNGLPHALLFVGQNGIGKNILAKSFASALLCTEFYKLGKQCGECHACHLSDAQTHPDLISVNSEPGHAIKIDQVREVITFVNQTALLGKYRVIIIDPAAAMNVNAANALLKTLEEPTPNTYLILITDQSANLPATIISRCQKIIFNKPSLEQGLAWLKENIKEDSVDLRSLLMVSNGAPFAAFELYRSNGYSFRQEFYNGLHQLSIHQADPIELADRWHEKDQKLMLDLLFSWVIDLLRIKTVQNDATTINQDFQKILLQVSQTIALESILQYIEHLQRIYGYIRSGLNLNQRLMLEELLIKWAQGCL